MWTHLQFLAQQALVFDSDVHCYEQIDGFVQERLNSIANALELRLLH